MYYLNYTADQAQIVPTPNFITIPKAKRTSYMGIITFSIQKGLGPQIFF